MSAVANVNSVVITGSLTRDPELRSTRSGTSVCTLRVAVNSRTKNATSGEFGMKPNYFNVTVWGRQAENCCRYLAKGRPVAVQGRLDWQERQLGADDPIRESVGIVASSVQFLGSKRADAAKSSEGEEDSPSEPAESISAEDKRLMRMKREELDELALDIGVESPEEYSDKRDLIEAIREKEAEKATADEAERNGSDPEDIPF